MNFLNKLKNNFASGFENRKLDSDLDQVKFIRQIKDFYRTKGTEESYKILFRVLYGEEVNIIKPSEFLIKPSDADYGFAQDFVVKPITGDPRNLKGSTLFQDIDEDDKNIRGASGAISDVKDFLYGGEHYYQISVSKDSIDGNFIVPELVLQIQYQLVQLQLQLIPQLDFLQVVPCHYQQRVLLVL